MYTLISSKTTRSGQLSHLKAVPPSIRHAFSRNLSLELVAGVAAVISQAVMASPLIDMLLKVPELSTYAQVYNITGGIVEINPLFAKCFNYDGDKRNCTFLAPTNDVSFADFGSLRLVIGS